MFVCFRTCQYFRSYRPFVVVLIQYHWKISKRWPMDIKQEKHIFFNSSKILKKFVKNVFLCIKCIPYRRKRRGIVLQQLDLHLGRLGKYPLRLDSSPPCQATRDTLNTVNIDFKGVD